jgi:hypothetical protein
MALHTGIGVMPDCGRLKVDFEGISAVPPERGSTEDYLGYKSARAQIKQ